MNGLLPRVRRLILPLTLSFIFFCGVTVYAVFYQDFYIVLFMTPFFLLGCARGHHPLVLLALAAIPAMGILLISTAKTLLIGFSLVTYDRMFIQQNLLMLAYNDWRVSTGLIVLIAGVVFFIYSLMSGCGTFTVTERRLAAFLGLASIGCIVALHQWEPDVLDWQYELSRPSIRGFVRSAKIPDGQLILPAVATEVQTLNNLSLGAPTGGPPDLFFILQESTFHPGMVRPGYETRSLFSSRADHTGYLHVHTWGGGTWRTEFSLLTQMRPHEFGGDGIYVFYTLAGRIKRSVFTLLKEQGYRTIVIYPVGGDFINAREFYTSIGVDEFYDPESLGISKNWDWRIPDENLYASIQNKLEESDKPTAVIMLTVNQHGPHDLSDPITDYLTRFKQSDKAYGEFLDYLLLRGKKAGVVAFGDHQPHFTDTLMPDAATKELTAYDIRCINFECANKVFGSNKEKTIDIVFLTPVALEEFGFKLDDVSLVQQKLLGSCLANIMHCNEVARLEFNSVFSHFVR